MVAITAVYGSYHALNAKVNLPVDPTIAKGCLHLACMTKTKGSIAVNFKLAIECANIVASAYFFYLLRKGGVVTKNVVMALRQFKFMTCLPQFSLSFAHVG